MGGMIMIFVTDDHRTIKLAEKREPRGVVPELDDTLMRSLLAEESEELRSKVKVTVERRVVDTVRKF